ncbi:hypothetical protein EYZ11_004135 [Aspergillus tanneri]|nr:hypothetical protein EYZ11_004135 [Aspergillus tanneri]
MAVYTVAIFNGASLFGRTIPNYLADRFGRFNIMLIMSCIASICILAIYIPVTSNTGIIVFASVFGFASGAFVSLAPTIMAQISPLGKVGQRIGTMYGMASLGALFGSPIGGALIKSWGGSYTGMIVFSGVMEFGGFLSFAIARYLQSGIALVKV